MIIVEKCLRDSKENRKKNFSKIFKRFYKFRTQSSQESTSASQVSRALSSPPPPAAPPTPPGVPYNSVAAGTTRAQSAARIAQQSPLKLEDQVTSVQMIADQLTIPKRSSTPPTVGVIGASNLMTSVTPGFAQVVTPATVASSTPVSLPLMSPTTTTPPPLHHMQQPVQSLPTGLMGMGSPVLESMSLMSQPVLNGPTSSLVAEQDSGLSSLKDLAQQALTPFQTQPRQQQPHQQSLLPQSNHNPPLCPLRWKKLGKTPFKNKLKFEKISFFSKY